MLAVLNQELPRGKAKQRAFNIWTMQLSFINVLKQVQMINFPKFHFKRATSKNQWRQYINVNRYVIFVLKPNNSNLLGEVNYKFHSKYLGWTKRKPTALLREAMISSFWDRLTCYVQKSNVNGCAGRALPENSSNVVYPMLYE